MRTYFSRLPLALLVFFGVFSTAPLWSLAFLGSPQHVWASHPWPVTAVIALAYWICPVIIAASILTQSFLLLPTFILECVLLLAHCLVNDIALSSQLLIMRLASVVVMSVLGVIIINRDSLSPFFAVSTRFWRKVTRFYTSLELTISDEAGAKLPVIMKDCSLTGIGVAIENKSARTKIKKWQVGQEVQIELGPKNKVKATVVWLKERENTQYAGFAVANLGAMEKFLQKLPAPNARFSLRHWLNVNWAASSFRRTALLAWVLVLAGTVGIPSCGKKDSAAQETATASQQALSASEWVEYTMGTEGVRAFFASQNLALVSNASEYAEKFAGTLVRGTATKITVSPSGFIVKFDLNTVRVLPASESDTALSDQANQELQGLLSSATAFSLVVPLSQSDSVTPPLTAVPDLNAVPQTFTFQVEGFLLAESSGTVSRGLLSRSAESFDRGNATQILATSKGGGGTTRCGGFSGCSTGSSNGWPFTPLDANGCPVSSGGTMQLGGGACSTGAQGQQCAYPPSPVTYQCCSTGPNNQPVWQASSCDCPDPKLTLMQRYPQICCPPGSILVAGACACPDGMVLKDGRCQPCPANSAPVNGACVCDASKGMTMRNGACMCSNPNDIIVNGVCTFSPRPVSCPRVGDTYPNPKAYTQSCQAHSPQSCFPNDITSTVPCSFDVAWCCPPTFTCGSGASLGQCDCPAPKTTIGLECKCSAGRDFDAGTNTCKCPAGLVFTGAACKTCLYGSVPNAAQTQCVCPPNLVSFNGRCLDCGTFAHVEVDATTGAKSCKCDPSAVPNPPNGSTTQMPGCRMCSGDKEVNAAGTNCQCKAVNPFPMPNGTCSGCGPNAVITSTNGTWGCQCNTGFVPNPVTDPNIMPGCRACGPNEEISNGVCVCKAGFGPPGVCNSLCTLPKTYDLTSKTCVCPASQPFGNGSGGCVGCTGANTQLYTKPDGTPGCQCLANHVAVPGTPDCTLCAAPGTLVNGVCQSPSPTPTCAPPNAIDASGNCVLFCAYPNVNVGGVCQSPAPTPTPCVAPNRIDAAGNCVAGCAYPNVEVNGACQSPSP